MIAHGSVEFCEATSIGLADESKKSLYGSETDETCVAPRHVDASSDFYIIFS